MRTLVALLFPLLFVTSGCASAAGTKQILTVDVLQSSLTALGEFQDTERALFGGGDIPQLTADAHRQISAKLEIAFRATATAALAVKAWKPGQPIPVDVLQILSVVQSLHELLAVLAIPSNSPLVAQSSHTISTVAELLTHFGGR